MNQLVVTKEHVDQPSATRVGSLILEDGTRFEGLSFGYDGPIAGEVVFSTGMVGYPEALTDPSFAGQILTLTFPIIGNYGVPEASDWESKKIHAAALLVSNYIDTPSHADSVMTLRQWLIDQQVPALEIKDTRLLTQHIREQGAMLGKIVFEDDIPFYDPNTVNLLDSVSTREILDQGTGDLTIALIDCGAKDNIARCLVKRGVRVITVPWDYNLFSPESTVKFDGILVSNGPGDPTMADKTIATIRESLNRGIPTMGICLGHQLLALAAGGTIFKLKFGHRSHNQPAIMVGTKRCYITTQNHGFSVKDVPAGFQPWFINANDGTNEGMRHESKPFLSVQFHPEAAAGPEDTEWIFDEFLTMVRGK